MLNKCKHIWELNANIKIGSYTCRVPCKKKKNQKQKEKQNSFQDAILSYVLGQDAKRERINEKRGSTITLLWTFGQANTEFQAYSYKFQIYLNRCAKTLCYSNETNKQINKQLSEFIQDEENKIIL